MTIWKGKTMENKTKNLKILQKIAQIGKILSKVAFVFSLIGACGCIIGWISTLFGNGGVIKIGGVTLYGMLGDLNIYNSKSAKATLVAWLIVCVGEAVLAKLAEVYFRNELAAGTPFTQAGARELKRLGILTMAVPTGCVVVAEIVQGIIAEFMNVAADSCMDLNFDNEASVVLGVMFIVCSFLCGYGAEMFEGKDRKHDNTL